MSVSKFASARVRTTVPKGQVSDLGYTIEHQHDGHGWHWPTSEHRDGTTHEASVNWVGPATEEQKKLYRQLLAGRVSPNPFRNAAKAKKVAAPAPVSLETLIPVDLGDGAVVEVAS